MTTLLNFIHNIASDKILVGIVAARPIFCEHVDGDFKDGLAELIHLRRKSPESIPIHRREAVRDMLRHGKYKPTGRGKPASEYLMRAIEQDTFPYINAPVDINNFISLKHLLPISLWDIDLAESQDFVFRFGAEQEQYVFNTGGQVIEVQDLVVGCRITSDAPQGQPIVNPIKDSLATKTTPETSFIAAAVYAPSALMSIEQVNDICHEFAYWLGRCGEAVSTAYAVLQQGNQVSLSFS